jgi:hypothetical protein
MADTERTKGQTKIDKALHINLEIEQHESLASYFILLQVIKILIFISYVH